MGFFPQRLLLIMHHGCGSKDNGIWIGSDGHLKLHSMVDITQSQTLRIFPSGRMTLAVHTIERLTALKL
jgi:hypothetical protein